MVKTSFSSNIFYSGTNIPDSHVNTLFYCPFGVRTFSAGSPKSLLWECSTEHTRLGRDFRELWEILGQYLGKCCLHLTIPPKLPQGEPSGDFIGLNCDSPVSPQACSLAYQGPKTLSKERLLKANAMKEKDSR